MCLKLLPKIPFQCMHYKEVGVPRTLMLLPFVMVTTVSYWVKDYQIVNGGRKVFPWKTFTISQEHMKKHLHRKGASCRIALAGSVGSELNIRPTSLQKCCAHLALKKWFL